MPRVTCQELSRRVNFLMSLFSCTRRRPPVPARRRYARKSEKLLDQERLIVNKRASTHVFHLLCALARLYERESKAPYREVFAREVRVLRIALAWDFRV